jgi:hypothetical protein
MDGSDELTVAVRPTVADRLRWPRVHASHVIDVPIREGRTWCRIAFIGGRYGLLKPGANIG